MPRNQTFRQPSVPEFSLPEKPYKKIAVTFIILTVILVLIIAYFSLSKATITLVPDEVLAAKEFSLDVPIAETNDPAVITASVTEKELNIAKSFEVKEYRTEEGRSHGIITIINSHTQSQTLIATTRFLSPDNKIYRLKANVEIPAGKEVAAEVEADKIGSSYDIAPARFTIPGLNKSLQEKIYGLSKEPFEGGVKKIGQIKSSDISSAQEEISSQLDALILKELGLNPSEDKIFLTSKEILGESLSNKEGDEVDRFTVTTKIKAKVVEISKEKLLSWVKEKYKSDLGLESEILNYDLDSFKYSLENVNTESVKIKVSISAFVLGSFDLNSFEKQKIYGMDEKALETFFKESAGVKEIQVNFWPFWVRTVPSMSDHIEIQIKK